MPSKSKQLNTSGHVFRTDVVIVRYHERRELNSRGFSIRYAVNYSTVNSHFNFQERNRSPFIDVAMSALRENTPIATLQLRTSFYKLLALHPISFNKRGRKNKQHAINPRKSIQRIPRLSASKTGSGGF